MRDPRDTSSGSESAEAPEPEPPRGLTLEVVRKAGDWARFEPVEEAVAAAALAIAATPGLVIGRAEACIALSDDGEIAALNATYRGKARPTNVLSFPSRSGARGAGKRGLGDVVLAAETVLREADGQGLAPVHHLQHLVVHGVLHLLGFDHETDTEANEMEAREVEILGRLCIADPYDERGASTASTPAEVHSSS